MDRRKCSRAAKCCRGERLVSSGVAILQRAKKNRTFRFQRVKNLASSLASVSACAKVLSAKRKRLNAMKGIKIMIHASFVVLLLVESLATVRG